MNRDFLKMLAGLFTAVCLIVACSDEENDFKGTDNHILSFQLEQAGLTYIGAITGEEIRISIPETLSLEGATVSFEISEHAAITPDPATITDWDKPREFTVTSYNETPRIYQYQVEKTVAVFRGDILFTSQEEVDAFASTGIRIIDGYVTVGKERGEVASDTIYDLSALSNIQEITYLLTVNPTYGGARVDAFKNLGKIGGIVIQDNPGLVSVDFGGVTEVKMDIVLNASRLTGINLNALRTVEGDLIGSTSRLISEFSLPALERVGGCFSLTNWIVLETLELPVLKEAGSFKLTGLSLLADIEVENLERCSGELTIDLYEPINSVSMPSLEYTGSLTIGSPVFMGLNEINFSALREIGNGLEIRNVSLATMDGFPALKSVKNRITIANCEELRSFEGLKNCIGTFDGIWTVYGNLYNPSLEEMQNGKYLPEEE